MSRAPILATDTVTGDLASFFGDAGARGQAITLRLTGADPALAAITRLRGGVEVRSSGNLTLGGDWNLQAFTSSGAAGERVGGQPITLTLRAAGDLLLPASISDGFGVAATSASAAAVVLPRAAIVAAQAASLRLVGGADLSSALPLAVGASGTAIGNGDVLIGRAATGSGSNAGTPASVLLRSSGGSIDIAAARDVVLLNRQAVVYTTGSAVPISGLAGYSPPVNNQLVATGQSPLLAGGGNVTVAAGRDVVGGSNGPSQYASDWLWRYGNGTNAELSLTWFSRYDLFQQGFAAFGGASVAVQAGRDATAVAVATPGSGASAYDRSNPGVRQQQLAAGGSAAQTAGRDVIDGFLLADGALARVDAGRDIATGNAAPDNGSNGLQVLYGRTAVDLHARGNADLGRIGASGLNEPLSRQGSFSTNGLLVAGQAAGATLQAQSDAGDLTLSSVKPGSLTGSYASTDFGGLIVPAVARFAAPGGDLRLNTVIQAPVMQGSLELLAQGTLTITGGLTVHGATPELERPFATVTSGLSRLLPSTFGAARPPFEPGAAGPREAVRLMARDGNVDLRAAVQVASPLRVVAGQDVTVASRLTVVQQDARELSLLQAGRDVRLNAIGIDRVTVQGPGDVVVLAGRDVDLGSAGGILTSGNQENRLLPGPGAAITVLAGVQLDRADADLAAARYFYAPQAGSAVDAESAKAYQQQLVAFVGQRLYPAPAAPLDLTQAVSAFEALAPEQRLLYLNQVLFSELRSAGRAAAEAAGDARAALYERGFKALAAVFPGARATGDIRLTASQIKTAAGGSITLLAPGGTLNAGEVFSGGSTKGASDIGIVTVAGGDVQAAVGTDVLVNQSRIFTVGQGDVLLWGSKGNIDAGRGAKTVTGAPPPLIRIDANGNVTIDTSGSFAGSGIAVLDGRSALDLYAPLGEINAGDAGIQSKGNAYFGAARIVGADNLSIGGAAVGAPPPPRIDNAAAGLGNLPQAATQVGNKNGDAESEEDKKRKARRRSLLLDFLGFGGDK